MNPLRWKDESSVAHCAFIQWQSSSIYSTFFAMVRNIIYILLLHMLNIHTRIHTKCKLHKRHLTSTKCRKVFRTMIWLFVEYSLWLLYSSFFFIFLLYFSLFVVFLWRVSITSIYVAFVRSFGSKVLIHKHNFNEKKKTKRNENDSLSFISFCVGNEK